MPAYKDKKGKWFVKFQLPVLGGGTRQVLKRGFDKKADALTYEHEKKSRKKTNADYNASDARRAFFTRLQYKS